MAETRVEEGGLCAWKDGEWERHEVGAGTGHTERGGDERVLIFAAETTFSARRGHSAGSGVTSAVGSPASVAILAELVCKLGEFGK